MPTNEEKREKARNLREICGRDHNEYGISIDEIEEALGIEPILPNSYDPCDVDALAELIEPEPERTCGIESVEEVDCYEGITFGEVVFTCGHSAELVYCLPNYCPTCGAKVVD